MDVICKQVPGELIPGEIIRNKTLDQPETSTQDEKIIVCASCNYHITDPSKQIIVNQSFNHIFANPHGHVFEIGCFSQASGCILCSILSNEFSWFAGFSWQICICRYCSSHLGWGFSSDTKHFFGLIIEKLNFP
jgi:hypothetical protein